MYEPNDLDIRSIRYDQNETVFIGTYSYMDLTAPKFFWHRNIPFLTHEVDEFEEGRPDLVIDAIYGKTTPHYESMDVLLHINNIDNPLSIRKGMEILYPEDPFLLEQFRYESFFKEKTLAQERATALGYQNKQSAADPARSSYVQNGYSLPPTVNASGKPPVTSDSKKIYVGGIK